MKPWLAHSSTIVLRTLGTWSISITSEPLPDWILCSDWARVYKRVSGLSQSHSFEASSTHHLGVGDEKVADGGGEVVHAPPAEGVPVPILGLPHDATDPAQVPQVVAHGRKVDRVQEVQRLDELVRAQEGEHRGEVRRLDLDRRAGAVRGGEGCAQVR